MNTYRQLEIIQWKKVSISYIYLREYDVKKVKGVGLMQSRKATCLKSFG
jgi:hypothetical protein